MYTKIEYFDDGTVWQQREMLNGKRDGLQQVFHDNGNRLSLYKCVNGDVIKIVEKWHYNGSREFVWNRKNGNNHGPKINFQYKLTDK